jgi:hypothetical protein
MWKLYSFDELKYVAKVGDKVRAAQGKYTDRFGLNDNGSNTGEITGFDEKRIFIECTGYLVTDRFLELWVPDVQEPKTPREVTMDEVRKKFGCEVIIKG